jgi:hypothetical protein
MKKLLSTSFAAFLILALGGCLASTTSPVGVNCDFSQQLPLWEMNQACVGGGG